MLPASAAVAAPVAGLHRPNVIFILADDLGYGDLGCFGQKLIQTPNIDRLAAEGMRFTQAYAGATVCAPSRCSLMTGKHNGHAAIRGNREIKPEGQVPMPADTFTVAHLMKQAGYATGLIGKWGLGHPGSDEHAGQDGVRLLLRLQLPAQSPRVLPGAPLAQRREGDARRQGVLARPDGRRRARVRPRATRTGRSSWTSRSRSRTQKLQVPDLGPYAERAVAGRT